MAIFDVPLARLRERGSIKWRRFDADVLPLFVAEMDADLAAPIAERLQRAIALGDTGYPGMALPENIMAYSVAIRGVRHTYHRMAASINR